MNPNEYVLACMRTNATEFHQPDPWLLHAACGCVTESAELLDALKKQMFYGKDIDRINVLEELGDLCWYVSLALYATGTTWEEIWSKNINKLKSRYPERFEEHKALERDLDAERQVLEKPHKGYHEQKILKWEEIQEKMS